MKKRIVFTACALAAACACAKDFPVTEKSGKAIQRAIDRAAEAGGGRVVLERGVYPSGTLYLRSHVELHVPEGAVLRGGSRPEDYDDIRDPRIGRVPERSLKAFIACLDGEDIAITGGGVIDGQGVLFYYPDGNPPDHMFAKPPRPRTRMVQLFKCRRIRFEDVTFKDSPGWTCWARDCEDFTVRRVKVHGDMRMINNDGFDIDGCRRVRILDCDCATGDDCIIMRANRLPNGECGLCEDMVVSNCTLQSSCQAVRIGCPSDGTLRRGLFTHLKVVGGNNGFLSDMPQHYLHPEDTGTCRTEDIVFSDCDVKVRNYAITWRADPGITLPAFGNVTFRNITFEAGKPIRLCGTAEAPLVNVRLENVKGKTSAREPFQSSAVRNLVLDRVDITTGLGPATTTVKRSNWSWESDPVQP